MIEIKVQNQQYSYDVYHIVKAFYPQEKIDQKVDETAPFLLQLIRNQNIMLCFKEMDYLNTLPKAKAKHLLNQALYQELCHLTGIELPWGILTGIRPTKLVMNKLEGQMSLLKAVSWLEQEYFVSKEKANLAGKIAIKEKSLLERLNCEEGYSLYVGIPFCPSICSYCSFSSYSLEQWGSLVGIYLEALLKEIKAVGAGMAHKKLNTIYIGGGTPTSLSAKQMELLLSTIEDTFSFSNLLEYTVEAGRPDSLDEEKLRVIKRHQVTRISINPQSMQQRTLQLVGRNHTVKETCQMFALARKCGFDNINMDLIAGLPGEDVEDMEKTLEIIRKLEPDNLTVHALAIKRAARLNRSPLEKTVQDAPKKIEEMIALAGTYASAMRMEPYYLYRQKNMAGNFENVGYAKVDKAGIYNILIMEEKQTIVACGAGASTKYVAPSEQIVEKGKRIIRFANVKDVKEYIERVDEMIDRKGELLWR